MNFDTELRKAQREFEDNAGAAYLFLTKNGVKRDYAKSILRKTLDDVIKSLEAEGY